MAVEKHQLWPLLSLLCFFLFGPHGKLVSLPRKQIRTLGLSAVLLHLFMYMAGDENDLVAAVWSGSQSLRNGGGGGMETVSSPCILVEHRSN